jgi:hypothetical protein
VSSHRTLPRSDGVAPAVQVADNAGKLWDIRIADGGLTFVASSQALAELVARPKAILPDGEIAHGQTGTGLECKPPVILIDGGAADRAGAVQRHTCHAQTGTQIGFDATAEIEIIEDVGDATQRF